MLIFDTFPIATALAVGCCIGSFLNVVIYRLPKMIEAEFRRECVLLDQDPTQEAPAAPRYNLAVPRSACPGCGNQIAGYDNIPVVSWLLLRGRCRHCKTTISARYPMIEAAGGLLSALAVWHFGPTMLAVGAALLVYFLIALFFIDLDTFYLPDSLTLPLVWLGLLVNLYEGFVPLRSAVIGAIAGYLLLWSVYWLFKLVTGKEGMGYGDFKLLAALGAWFGWQSLPTIILAASVAGTVIGGSMILFGKRARSNPIPFGPYLATAGLIVLFLGPRLNLFILGLGGTQ
jgi:leader peptidase (prepilin peptidase)/N-methyltransferase